MSANLPAPTKEKDAVEFINPLPGYLDAILTLLEQHSDAKLSAQHIRIQDAQNVLAENIKKQKSANVASIQKVEDGIREISEELAEIEQQIGERKEVVGEANQHIERRKSEERTNDSIEKWSRRWNTFLKGKYAKGENAESERQREEARVKLAEEIDDIIASREPLEKEIEKLCAHQEQKSQQIEQRKSVIAEYELTQDFLLTAAVYTADVMQMVSNYAQNIRHEYGKAATRNKVRMSDSFDAALRLPDAPKEALTRLMTGRLREGDLSTVEEFVSALPLTENKKIRAFQQFVNQTVLPHRDYFEIWAGKIDDYIQNCEALASALTQRDTSLLPQLRIHGSAEMASKVSLLPQVDGAEPDDTRQAAIDKAQSYKKTAYAAVNKSLRMIHDKRLGTLESRLNKAITVSLEPLEEFNEVFEGIDRKIAVLDKKISTLLPVRNRAEFQLESATRHNQNMDFSIDLQHERIEDPVHNRTMLATAASGVGRGLIALYTGVPAGQHMQGALSTGGILANQHMRHRQQAIDAMKRAEYYQSQKKDIDALSSELESINAEIAEAIGSKKVKQFLGNEVSMDLARQAYMLLPRLISGRSNLAMLDYMAKKHGGFEKVDDFIEGIKEHAPRLSEALESFALGLADSNDMSVILAEANTLRDISAPQDRVLYKLAEDYIKPEVRSHYTNASIVDVLKENNILCSGTPFHSFGEVVKKETDHALKALLEGEHYVDIIGSQDIRKIFDFYLYRHGESEFFDPYGKNYTGKPASIPKSVPSAEEIALPKKFRDEVYRLREEENIPRLNNIFTEICAYEYYLSQGVDFTKERRVADNPQIPGSFIMVAETVGSFVQQLSIDVIREAKKQHGEAASLGPEIESIIAQSFIDFFAEMGAKHKQDVNVQEKLEKVKQQFEFTSTVSTALNLYAEVITDSAKDNYEMFKDIYKQNLEKYLECASKENRTALYKQLDALKEQSAELLPPKLALPGSSSAKIKAHDRNHARENLGVNKKTWEERAKAIRGGEARER